MKLPPATLMRYLLPARFSPLSMAILLAVMAWGIWANTGYDPREFLVGITYGWPFPYCDPDAARADEWYGWYSPWAALGNLPLLAAIAFLTCGLIEWWVQKWKRHRWWTIQRYSRLSLLIMAGGILANLAAPLSPYLNEWGWPFLYYYMSHSYVEPPRGYSFWHLAANIACFALAAILAAELIRYAPRMGKRWRRSTARINDG